MRIEKGITENFEEYAVVHRHVTTIPQKRFLGIPYGDPPREVQTRLSQVVEADDDTGLLVQQVTDEYGNVIYTDGSQDIAIGNTAKLLLLVAGIRNEFLAAGFQPKLIKRYEKGLEIVRNGTISNVTSVNETI